MKKLKVIVEKTNTGYSAYAQDYEVYTAGGDVQELISNIIEAFNFHFEDDDGNRKITVTRKDLDLSFSIPSLFQLYPINVKHFAQRVGMNYTLLSQYVQGRKQPSEKQTARIVKALQEVGKELSQVRLL